MKLFGFRSLKKYLKVHGIYVMQTFIIKKRNIRNSFKFINFAMDRFDNLYLFPNILKLNGTYDIFSIH